MSFFYKHLSEEEKEDIRLEAKKIMDSFGEKLSVLGDLPEEGGIFREESYREEKKNFCEGKEFRKRIFKNAKNKNEDFIIAEKKKW